MFHVAPQQNLLSLPSMPQTKKGRKKWRKKQRSLMEAAALANQSIPTASSIYQSINFVPPVPILQPPLPTSKPLSVTNSSCSFTPIVPSNLSPQKPQPSIDTLKRKQNCFDLPDNCPTSLK